MKAADVGVTLNYEDLRGLKAADAPAKVKFVDDLVSQLELVWKPLPCKAVEEDTGLCSLTKQQCPSVRATPELGPVWWPQRENTCPSYEESNEEVQSASWDEAEGEAPTETEESEGQDENSSEVDLVERDVESVQSGQPAEETRDIMVDGRKAVLEVNTGEKDQVIGRVKHVERLAQAEVKTSGGKRKFSVVDGDERCTPGGKPKGSVRRGRLGKPTKTMRLE